MTRTIWKFPLLAADSQIVKMPKGAKILSVDVQYGNPHIWALVDPNASGRDRLIFMHGTGHVFEPPPRAAQLRRHPDEDTSAGSFDFVGTYMLLGGDLVFHVFDGGETG